MLGDDIGVRKMSESGKPERDFPLGFHWSTGQDLIGGPGFPLLGTTTIKKHGMPCLPLLIWPASQGAGSPIHDDARSMPRDTDIRASASRTGPGHAFGRRRWCRSGESSRRDHLRPAKHPADWRMPTRPASLLATHGKRAFNVGVNAKNRPSAVVAIAKDLNSLKVQMRQRPAGSQCEWSGSSLR